MSNAERLLAQAGGENTNLVAGQGQKLVIIPGVEHITTVLCKRVWDKVFVESRAPWKGNAIP